MSAISLHSLGAKAAGAASLNAGTVPASNQRFTLHYLEDSAVLFDTIAQRLYALNTTAAFIWSCLEERLPEAAIADRLHTTFGVPAAAAAVQVRDVLASQIQLALAAATAADRALVARAAAIDEGRRSAPGPVAEHRYRLLDSVFRLRCSHALPVYDLVRAFRLLRADAADQDIGNEIAAEIPMDVEASGDRVTLRIDGAAVDRCWRTDQVLPMVKASMVETALRRSRDLFAVHAAAVSKGAACLLLPGASGSGKSTLAAALAADGSRLLGDDTVVLARGSMDVRPMALPICLKDGSWQLLARRYPELAAIGVNFRGDGKLARYVLPPESDPRAHDPGPDHGPDHPGMPRRVTAIVFPRRGATAPAGLVAMPRSEALALLMQGLCPLGEGLSAPMVEGFVRWIGAIDCYELRYAGLEDGVAHIAALLP